MVIAQAGNSGDLGSVTCSATAFLSELGQVYLTSLFKGMSMKHPGGASPSVGRQIHARSARANAQRIAVWPWWLRLTALSQLGLYSGG